MRLTSLALTRALPVYQRPCPALHLSRRALHRILCRSASSRVWQTSRRSRWSRAKQPWPLYHCPPFSQRVSLPLWRRLLSRRSMLCRWFSRFPVWHSLCHRWLYLSRFYQRSPRLQQMSWPQAWAWPVMASPLSQPVLSRWTIRFFWLWSSAWRRQQTPLMSKMSSGCRHLNWVFSLSPRLKTFPILT